MINSIKHILAAYPNVMQLFIHGHHPTEYPENSKNLPSMPGIPRKLEGPIVYSRSFSGFPEPRGGAKDSAISLSNILIFWLQIILNN